MTQLSTFNNLTGLQSASSSYGKSATYGGGKKKGRKTKRTSYTKKNRTKRNKTQHHRRRHN